MTEDQGSIIIELLEAILRELRHGKPSPGVSTQGGDDSGGTGHPPGGGG